MHWLMGTYLQGRRIEDPRPGSLRGSSRLLVATMCLPQRPAGCLRHSNSWGRCLGGCLLLLLLCPLLKRSQQNLQLPWQQDRRVWLVLVLLLMLLLGLCWADQRRRGQE